MRAPYWDILGIPPTPDEGDIRRAYAIRLRVTNPEDDADGFKALREAYEHALAHARYMRMRPPADTDTEDSSENADADADIDTYRDQQLRVVPPVTLAAGAAQTPAETATPDPLEIERRNHEALCRRLVTALEQDRPAHERLEAFNDVLKSPAMHQLDVFTSTEGWMSHVLITNRPASNALFEPAIAFFAWGEQRVGSHDAASQHVLYLYGRVADELAGERLLQRLKNKQHEYHKAWKETMLPPSRRGPLNKFFSFWRATRVIEFLRYVSTSVVRETLNEEAVAWWVKRAPRAGTVTGGFAILALAIVLSPVAFLAFEHREEISDYLSRTSYAADRPAAPPAHVSLLERLPADASDDTKRYAARRDCKEAMTRVGDTFNGIKLYTAWLAKERCERILHMTPDSLLMQQYAGIIALHFDEPELALERFETILAASPDDAYALFGKGLVSTLSAAQPHLGDPKDMSDALAMNPDVKAYFASFGMLAPDVEPSSPKPPSRLPTLDKVRADTDAESIENPDALDGTRLARHFGVDNTTAGKVVLECVINVEGLATDCHIRSEEPPNVGLGEVGLLAMKDIRYKPPMLAGEPVPGLPLTYTLHYNTESEAEVQPDP